MVILEKMKRLNKLDDLDLNELDFETDSQHADKQDGATKEEWIRVIRSPFLLLNLVINSVQW